MAVNFKNIALKSVRMQKLQKKVILEFFNR